MIEVHLRGELDAVQFASGTQFQFEEGAWVCVFNEAGQRIAAFNAGEVAWVAIESGERTLKAA